jgi:predicted transcriptional regulator
MATKITIVKVRRNPYENINQELQWFGNALGLFNLRDRDSSCFRIFITLVRKAKRNETMSSDEIAEHLHLTRGTVVHHLTRLMESGLVIRERQGYLLRENTLAQVVKEMKKDSDALFSDLMEVAKEIDDKLS